MGMYPAVRQGIVEEIGRSAMSLAVLLVMTWSRMSLGSEFFAQRMLFSLVAFLACVFFMPLMRLRLRQALGRTSWWGFPTLVCGHDAAVVSVYQWLSENRRLGLRPLGVVAEPHGVGTGQGDARLHRRLVRGARDRRARARLLGRHGRARRKATPR